LARLRVLSSSIEDSIDYCSTVDSQRTNVQEIVARYIVTPSIRVALTE